MSAACRICSQERATSDLRLALEKIGDRFGVRTLMLEGGGKINAGMLRAGLIDEVSLLVAPIADARIGTPSLFDAAVGSIAPRRLALESIERREDDMVLLRYRVLGNDDRAWRGGQCARLQHPIASPRQKTPTMQSIAGAALDKSGRLDLNQRPPAPEAGALPGYATPRRFLPNQRIRWRARKDSNLQPSDP